MTKIISAFARRAAAALIMLTAIFSAPANALHLDIFALTTVAQFLHGGMTIKGASPSAALTQSAKQLETICLATALYHEARGEKEEGQKAVAQVILNRVKSDVYPATICGVVYENATKKNACQFSYACDGISDTPKEEAAFREIYAFAAHAVSYGVYAEGLEPRSGNTKQMKKSQITHYHTKAVSPAWGKKLEPIKTIGSHIFYRSERAAKSL